MARHDKGHQSEHHDGGSDEIGEGTLLPQDPTSHSSTHISGGSDAITSQLDYRAYPQRYGTSLPTVGEDGRTIYDTNDYILWLDNGSSWLKMAASRHNKLDAIGADDHHIKFTPTDHDGRDHSAVASSVRLDELAAPTSSLDINNQALSNVSSIGGGGDAVTYNDNIDMVGSDINNIGTLGGVDDSSLVGNLNADLLDGVQLDDITWSDIAISTTDIEMDDITPSNNDLDMNQYDIQNLGVIDLDTTPSTTSFQTGRFRWDTVDKTARIDTDITDVSLQIGQEVYIRAYNNTGSTINNGEVVYMDGGTGDNPTISLAQADDKNEAHRVVGMATHDIVDSNVGYITTYGRVKNLDTSSYAAGDELWLSPTTPGGITTTEPAEEYQRVKIGKVIRSDASNGIILFNRTIFDNADDIKLNHLTGASYQNLQQYINTMSAGYISGGSITDNGDGTVTVASGTGIIKDVDSETAPSFFFDWSENSSLSLTDQQSNFIYIDYNAGSPTVNATTDFTAVNGNTQFMRGRVFRNGTNLTIFEGGIDLNNFKWKDCRMDFEVYGTKRASGLIIGETGTRNLTITSGIYYCHNTRKTSPSFDSSGTDTFREIYRDGAGGWTITTGHSQVDNQSYDDGSGTLASLGNNDFGVYWVYEDFDNDVYIQYGQESYNQLSDALDANVPQTYELLSDFGFFLGRIIIEEDGTTFDEIQSAFEERFNNTPVTDHGDLAGLGDNDHDQYLLRSGGNTMTGNLPMGGYNLNNVGNIVPQADSTYDIGSDTNRFTNIYADNLYGTAHYADIIFEEKKCAVCDKKFKEGDSVSLIVNDIKEDGTYMIPKHQRCDV